MSTGTLQVPGVSEQPGCHPAVLSVRLRGRPEDAVEDLGGIQDWHQDLYLQPQSVSLTCLEAILLIVVSFVN